MIVLGIDPGLARTGWAILEHPDGRPTRLIDSGLIETDAGVPLPDRLLEIHQGLGAVLSRHAPSEAAVEELFFLKAAQTIGGTLQARGVILLAAAVAGLKVWPYNPRAVKLALTGSGAAAKPQMQKVLQRALGLDAVLSPDDVADAAAIALCHIRSNRFKKFTVLDRVGGRR